MNERVYQRESPPESGEQSNAKLIVESPAPSAPVSGEHHKRNISQESYSSSKVSYAGYGYGGPNPGTYVVRVPKEQIYRVPPHKNAHKYKLYTKKKARKGGCRCCSCTMLAIILILVLLLAVTSAVLHLIDIPKAPSYSIESVSIKGVNLSTTATTTTISILSPVFNITLKTQNNNGKIGIYYEQGSEIKIYHDGVNLCNGELPAFYQAPKTVTVFSTELSGAGIVLSKPARDKLVLEQKSEKVPLNIDVKVPVKIKIGAVKTWTITVEVSCDVTVNALTANAKVVSKDCKVKAKPW